MNPGPRTSDGDSDRAPSAAADGRPVRHAVEFEWGDDRRLSTLVVDAVAEMAGIDPLGMDEPLYRTLDPDALDELFRARTDGVRRPGGRIEFELQDLDVTVHGDGLLEVMRPAARSTPADERAE